MTRNDYLAANPKPVGGQGINVIGFGAIGRTSFPCKGDKRRRKNQDPFPLPELSNRIYSSGVKVVPVTEGISRGIAKQVRYQDRKEKRNKLKAAA